MPRVTDHRRKLLRALLDDFVGRTGLPIRVYEKRDDAAELVVSTSRNDAHRSFCRVVAQVAGGAERCEQDQCVRAGQSWAPEHYRKEEPVLCHMGVWNQRVPIVVDDQVRAVFLFGEMRILDEACEEQAARQWAEGTAALDIPADLADQMRRERGSIPALPLEKVEEHKASLRAALEWAYSIFKEQDELEEAVERVCHEMQTRVQALMAKTANLAGDLATLRPRDAKERMAKLLLASVALDTLLQTLGPALGPPKFESKLIPPLLSKAKAIYEDEADQRQIEIRIESPLQLWAEISEPHLQHALNNLVQNAVKYSFSTVPSGRTRYVKITAAASGNELVISVENYGIGILSKEIESGGLFGPGQRGKLTATEFRRGMGMGLYFVKKVVDAHHGSITIDSQLLATEATPERKPHLNKFTVRLPLVQRGGHEHGQDRVD